MRNMYLYLACGLYYQESTGISFEHDVVAEFSLGPSNDCIEMAGDTNL